MKCLTAMNPGWRPEVPPMPVPNNSTQSGSIAPPLTSLMGDMTDMEVSRETKK